MSSTGDPQELFSRPSTNSQHPKSSGHLDSRRGRKKPSSLARAAQMNATSESKVKPNTQKISVSGSQQSNPSKGSKKSLLKQGDRQPKKSNHTRNKSNNEKPKTFGHANAAFDRKPTDLALSGHESDGTDATSRTRTAAPKTKSSGALINYSSAEINATGPIFADPSSLGFMKRASISIPRPAPRYMFNQPRLLVPPPFYQDPWDEQNQRKMLEIEQANAGSDYQGTYEEFQKMREVERKRMEGLGLVDAENTRKDLSEAIFFQGTCLDMCPIFERTRRSLENNVKDLEKDPQTNRISRDRAIKAFSRPAAGQPPPMPSDVRPPHVLSSTLDYLIQDILPHLPEAHSFIWDRTRSIRQDFIYQNYYGPAAIDCNEKIVRIHLLSLHVMPGSDVEFSQQQELEQFNKALQTLTEIYQDVRHHGGSCPNEAEFRAYHLISHFRDSELERDLQMLPKAIFQDHMIQLAIVFRTLMSQNNIVERGYKNVIGATNLFVEFFRRVFDPKTPLLLAFLLETHFNEIRFYALKSLTRSYHTKGKPFSGQSLQMMLGFDTIDELVSFVSYYDVDIVHDQGEVLIDLCNKEKLETQYKLNSLQAKPKRSPAHSSQLSNLLSGKTYQSLVCAGHSNADLHLEMPKTDTIIQGSFVKTAPATQKVGTLQNISAFAPKQVAPSAPVSASSSTPTLGFGGRIISVAASEPGASNQLGKQGAQTSSFFNSQPGASGAFNTAPKPFSFSNGSSVAENAPNSVPPTNQLTTTELKRKEPAPISNITSSNPTLNFGLRSDTTNKVSFGGFMKESNKKEEKEKEKEKKEKRKEEKEEKNGDTPSVLQQNGGLFNKKEGLPPAMNFASSVNSSSKTTAASTLPKLAPNFEEPKQKTSIVDHSKYSGAVEKVYEELLRNAVNDELYKVLGNLHRKHQENMERQRVIGALSEELYQAFVLEILHKAAWQSLAKHFHEQTLKKKTISKVKACCQRSVQSQESKKKRLNELKAVQFKLPSLKRRSTCTSENMMNKRNHYSSRNTTLDLERSDTSVISTQEPVTPQSFTEKQTELERLWAPMDLAPFAKIISERVKLKSQHLFKCLLVVEDWKSPYSKWLNTKFNLQLSDDKTYYKHIVKEPKLEVSFQSLPKNVGSMEESFSNSPFVVFESGIFEESHKKYYTSLGQKLERDCNILQKLMKICDKFSFYKIQLLVIVWDTTNTNADYDQLLEFFQSKIHSDCLQRLDVCSMSSNEGDLAEITGEKVMQMSQHFKAALTERGARKRKQLETQRRRHAVDLKLEPSPVQPAEARRASEVLQEKEAQALKRAMQVQKHSFLSKHASFNRSMDSTNTSGVMRTPNTTLANMTLVNLNNSILGNNTFLNSNDVSFLRRHGGAPETTCTETSFSHPPVPKKLQELRDLTASIKAKYVPKGG